jgi:hypothetical protein
MRFLGSCQSLLFERRVSNWVFSVLFFLLMITSSCTNLICASVSDPIPDIFSFVLSLSAYRDATQPELHAPLIGVTLSMAFIFSALLFIFLVPLFAESQKVTFFVALLFNCVPLTFVLCANIFTKGYLNSPFPRLYYPFLIPHLSQLPVLLFVSIFISNGPYFVNHCFTPRSPCQAVVLSFFFFVSPHLGYLSESRPSYFQIIQSILAICVSFYVAVVPVYMDRMLNVLLLTLTLTTASSEIALSQGSLRVWYGPLILVAGSFVAGLAVFYGIHTVWVKGGASVGRVFKLAFSRRDVAARELLETIGAASSIGENPQLAIQLAFHLKAGNLPRMLRTLELTTVTDIGQSQFRWAAQNYFASATESLPQSFSRYIRGKLEKLIATEAEFWRIVWLSHVHALSKLACQLGRRRYRFSCLLERTSSRFHLGRPDFEEVVGGPKRSPLRLNSWLLISACTAVLASVVVYVTALEQTVEVRNVREITNLVSNISDGVLELALSGEISASFTRSIELMALLEARAGEDATLKAFVDFEIAGTTLVSAFRDYFECLAGAKCCGGLPFVDIFCVVSGNRSTSHAELHCLPLLLSIGALLISAHPDEL